MRRQASMTLESFGVLIGLRYPRKLAREIANILPPSHRLATGRVVAEFTVAEDHEGYRAMIGDELIVATPDLNFALHMLDQQIRQQIGLHAPAHIFIHAGTVAVGDAALLLPGSSFAGKTTLVAELVRAGATYFSDEFAVLDANGAVHPYPRRLAIRGTGDWMESGVPVSDLGGVAGDRPARPAIIAALEFVDGRGLDLKPQSPGAGALLLLSHAVAARARSEEVLAAAGAAAAGAASYSGVRGECGPAAERLLRMLREATPRTEPRSAHSGVTLRP